MTSPCDVDDRVQGDRVVAELAKGLGVSRPPLGAQRPLSPVRLISIGLGENVSRGRDGSFSGTGTWTASKWTFESEEHEAEIFFDYSLAERRAEQASKDDEHDANVVGDFARALRDGPSAE